VKDRQTKGCNPEIRKEDFISSTRLNNIFHADFEADSLEIGSLLTLSLKKVSWSLKVVGTLSGKINIHILRL